MEDTGAILGAAGVDYSCVANRRPWEPLKEQLGKIKAQAERDGLWAAEKMSLALVGLEEHEQREFMLWARAEGRYTAWAVYEQEDDSKLYVGWLAWDPDALTAGLMGYAKMQGQTLTGVRDLPIQQHLH